jgi:hypothetical protein
MTMIKSDGWIVMRSRVSLAGRVTAGDGGAASGGTLSLAAVQRADRGKAKSPPPAIVRQYDTSILGDGFYFFLDLPAGDYVLNGQDERGNELETQQVSIPPVDDASRLHVVGVDLSAAVKPGAGERPPEVKAPVAPARRRRGSKSAPAGNPRA